MKLSTWELFCSYISKKKKALFLLGLTFLFRPSTYSLQIMKVSIFTKPMTVRYKSIESA